MLASLCPTTHLTLSPSPGNGPETTKLVAYFYSGSLRRKKGKNPYLLQDTDTEKHPPACTGVTESSFGVKQIWVETLFITYSLSDPGQVMNIVEPPFPVL